MTDVTDRLKSAADDCVKSYKAWQDDKTDSGIREKLVESVHELRKAAARLEIELAISERDMKKSKPIPIPPHRSSRSKGKNSDKSNNKGGGKSNRKRSSSGRGKKSSKG